MSRRRGLTLVEVLVVMAVAGILTVLLVMGLRQSRRRVADVNEISMMRLTLSDFAGWAADHNSQWPTYGLPKKAAPTGAYSLIDPGARNFDRLAAGLFMGANRSWPHILFAWSDKDQPHWYGTGGVDLSLFQGLENQEGLIGPFPSRYHYSDTLRTRPDLWIWPGRGRLLSHEEIVSLWGEDVRVEQVSSPAAKGVLSYEPPAEIGKKAVNSADRIMFVAFADGSAMTRRVVESQPTADDPTSFQRTPGPPVRATLNGYHGRDF